MPANLPRQFFFRVALPGCLLLAAPALRGQELRQSFLLYQLDALPLNPAYAGASGFPAFEAFYFGNFSAAATVSRSGLVSVHGPGRHARTAWGGVMQFYKASLFGEVSASPAFSWKVPLPSGTLSFGGTLGFNYFDFDDDGFGSAPLNFGSIDSGLGVYFQSRRAFAGVSALKLFEQSLFFKNDNATTYIPREKPISAHGGFVLRLYNNILLKPAALLRYAKLYELPSSPNDAGHYLSYDVQATFVVNGTYMVGLLAGRSDYSGSEDLGRYGGSVVLLLGNFHLGYAIQHNSNQNTAVELPISHLLQAGYIFTNDGNEAPLRLF
ncbi:MAG: type IX secretion system membrane protein PorP/SprF [Saprospiraceae bacterium]|nr:MAG: type IX secretion system membrane protein PorP/SprF [Saprospiraceae bacterium]